MQNAIDSIVYSAQPFPRKLEQLAELFLNEEVVFTDMDDTLVEHDALFFSKLHFWRRVRGVPYENAFERVLGRAPLAEAFFQTLPAGTKKLVVISRNHHEFVKYLIAHKKHEFTERGLDVIGGIGNLYFEKSAQFFMRREDKLSIVGDHRFITDMFEYPKVKHHKKLLIVGGMPTLKSVVVTVAKKGRLLFLFVVKNVFKPL